MEFKGNDNPFNRFKIKKSEIERAKMGFEATGDKRSRKKVGHEVNLGIGDRARARLTVAGNIALINSLSVIENPDQITEITIDDARQTIETGLSALHEAKAVSQEASAMRRKVMDTTSYQLG